MRVLIMLGMGLLVACATTDSLFLPASPKLEVAERSATTLLLRWDAMGTTNNYTVDYLHVHPLPFGDQASNTVFVTTLAAGATAQAVTAADYEKCR